MNVTNPPVAVAVIQTNATLVQTNTLATHSNPTFIGGVYHFFGHESSLGTRLMLIVVLAVLLHLTVKAVRNISEWIINKSNSNKNPFDFFTHQPKFITVIQLIASGATAVMYFLATGLVLQEFGVSLTKYLASASIVALAISFGSQGLVQDVVISLTLIFSDAMDSGDMVEIAGTVTVVGRVEEIGLRFTTLLNLYNQTVFIPNRTIANVSRFPQGGVYAYADIQLPAGADTPKVVQAVEGIALGMWAQFGAIILSEPTMSSAQMAQGGGWEFLRVHFKIWPGQGSLIETTFRQQVTRTLKNFDPNYADWQVTVTYRAAAGSKSS
ncbi:MAG: mechanosensitive ion channel domain-containing protein [Verrucomicrobiota bacterium]|jgi:small conductance mechanosensitive channel